MCLFTNLLNEFIYFPILLARNTLQQRQELVLRAAEELAAEGHPVMLILDDFNHIVSHYLAPLPHSNPWVGAAGFISNMYSVNQKMVVIAVCSSATTYNDLADGINWH